MQIYLMRHAHADAAADGGTLPDSERPISERGRRQTRRLARFLAASGVTLDRAFSSPLVRARQTAEILAESQASPPPVDATDAVGPGFSAEALMQRLGKLPPDSHVLLVGHAPDVGVLAARLIGLPDDSRLHFGPGTLARIDVDTSSRSDPSGRLRWLLPADLAEALGSADL